MVSPVEQNAHPRPQVLFVGANDSKQLLEVYVKRSLSLNDGSHHSSRRQRRPCKWLTIADQNKRDRKHSSDTSILSSGSKEEVVEHEAFSEPETDRKAQGENETTDYRPKRSKKKSSLRRNDGSSASHDSLRHDGRQPDKPSLHLKPSGSKEDLGKNKAEPVTEIEISDKCNRCRKNYPKNSLTRNNGFSAPQSSDEKPRKLFSPIEKDKQDGSQKEAFKRNSEDLIFENSELPAKPQLEDIAEVKNTKEGKKIKKHSVWKNVLGWFTRGTNNKQDEEDDDRRPEKVCPTPEPETPPFFCLPISTGDGIIQHNTKSSMRRRAHKRVLLKRSSKDKGLDKTTVPPLNLDQSTEAHVQCAAFDYYEKMSEELEKIVNEVKNSPTDENRTFTDSVQPIETDAIVRSQEDIIKRMVDLIKQEGDFINKKLEENPVVSSYFSTITYGSFEQLADQYVNKVPQQPPQVPVVAPEMVKFAFTLDFTARVAALSRHAPGNILGFGNQYLTKRFSYMCENHPHITDVNTEK